MTITLEDIEAYMQYEASKIPSGRAYAPSQLYTLVGFVQWMRSKEKTE